VLLLSRDDAYNRLTWLIAAPLTTRIRTISSAVLLTPARDGVRERCIVSLDNLSAVHVDWLEYPIARLDDERMAEVDRAIHFALGLRD
jgi:mRNA-degrading endonuclease toxin of MazEF toxin-antitoxin module